MRIRNTATYVQALAEAGDARAAWMFGLTYFYKYITDGVEGGRPQMDSETFLRCIS